MTRFLYAVLKQYLIAVFALLVVSVTMSVTASTLPVHAQQRASGSIKKPRLVIMLSFDQMRGDYIDRWRTYWGKTGFNRLLARGVHFTNCLNDHASNITAPGHAILMTGHYPNKTGIVSNDMYDRVIGREQYCVEDTTHLTFGIKNPRDWTSPVNLEVPTLGDILKKSSPKSTVVGVSYKDRAAILMAGKKADAAFWFEAEAGGFTTSTYYGFSTMPAWLATWRTENAYTRYHGKVWNATVPLSSYYVQDTCTWETKFPLGTTYFPHVMPQRTTDQEKKEYDRAFSVSPFVVDHQFDFARAVMQQYNMGQDNSTDILNLSISTTDYVGHAYGADSREVFELYIHVDRELGKFLSFVDRTVGADNYIVVVASDHGVAPVPERAIANGEEAGRLVELDVVTSIERYLQERLPNAGAKYVRSFVKPNLFLNEQAFASKQEYRRWTDSVAVMVRGIEGIGAVATFEQLQNGIKPTGVAPQTFALMQKDFFPRRNGDMLIYPQYGWIFGSITATHGVYHTYDRHIPFIVSGFGCKPGVSTLKVSASYIAPTLAELLGITMPPTQGISLFKKIF